MAEEVTKKPVAGEEKANKKPLKVKKSKMEMEEIHSRVMDILKKEYKFENWLLGILSPILILYGVYIVMGTFGSFDLAGALGDSEIPFFAFFFDTTLKRVLTGSFLILIGTLVIIYLVIPFLRPSFVEMKKVSWPSIKTLARNTARVFLFLIFLSVVFALFGFALDPLFKWLISL